MKLFEVQNQPAPWLLCESAEKAVHLEHLEDLIFNEGYLGAEKALNYIKRVQGMLAQGAGEPSTVTVKWDGAPAIHCGIDPADGKFFIGTKGVFNKTPILCKSVKDIDTQYGDRPELANKLKMCLKYLPKLGISGVVKGDLMFTQGDERFKREVIDGEEYLVFNPNTINYAVPINSDLAKRMMRAKIGIVFHTSYEGTEISNMTARFGFSAAGLQQSKDVWFDDAYYTDLTGRASLTDEENNLITNGLTQSAMTLRKIKKPQFDVIIKNTEFASYIKPFINNNVRGGEQVGDPLKFLQQFTTFYRGKMEAEIAKLKGGAESPAAQARIKKIQDKEQFIADNSNILLGILAMYKRIVELKLVLVRKLEQIESIGTFVRTADGYKVTKPEGFVAVGHDGGAVKLIDRIEFSRSNFSKDVIKGWQK